MSGEFRMVKAAVILCLAAAVPAAVAAWLVRGPNGAAGVGMALALVLANTVIAAAVLVWAGKRWPLLAPAVAMPSYAFRMAGLVFAMAKLRHASFVDAPAFAIAFGAAVVFTLFAEARAYGKTPWAALTFLNGGLGASSAGPQANEGSNQ